MNVNTTIGVFGKYTKTSHPDGSVSLADHKAGQFIDIKAEDLPLDKAAVEALFAAKYPQDQGSGQEKTS